MDNTWKTSSLVIKEIQIKPTMRYHFNPLLLLLLSRFSRVRLCDPIDSSPPGSLFLGILQARTLECVATSFSNPWRWKVKVKSLSHVWLFATPRTAAYQAPPSMGFSRQEYWSGVPLPSPPSCLGHLILSQCGLGSYGKRNCITINRLHIGVR